MISITSGDRYYIVCFPTLAASGVAILIGAARSALCESHFLTGFFHAVGATETPRESVGLVATAGISAAAFTAAF
jgi:hypothetical protein